MPSFSLPVLADILIIALVVVLLVRGSEALLGLRARILRRGVARLLADARAGSASETGESRVEIRARSFRDAKRILTTSLGTRATWVEAAALRSSVETRLPDLARHAPDLERRFGELEPALTKRFRWAIWLLAMIWSLILVTTLQYWLPVAGSSTSSASWLSGISFSHSGSGKMAGLLLTTILVAITSALWYRLLKNVIGDLRTEPESILENEPQHLEETIGRDDQAIRAINFAGGGFDTIMQLGVTHALMVIQGRPPDAVIGVSAGAFQAAALAEVLQAGEEYENRSYQRWDELDPGAQNDQVELHRRRMSARVAKFREFVGACHTARERLFDSVTPDAYQVNTNEPLEPLRTPLFDPLERTQREESIRAESGLARLYNDLLKLNLPVSMLARLIRRILGLKAAGALRTWPQRLYHRGLETAKIWLLIGTVLVRASPIVGPLSRALLSGKPSTVRPATAESLIFRFALARKVKDVLGFFVSHLLTLAVWLGIGLWPTALIWLVLGGNHTIWHLVGPVLVYVLLPVTITVVFYRDGSEAGKTLRASLEAFWLVLKWAAAICLLVVIPEIVDLLGWAMKSLHDPYPEPRLLLFGEAIRYKVTNTVFWLAGFAAVAALVGLGAYLLSQTQDLLKILRGEDPSTGGPILQRLLATYNLSRSLLHNHSIRQFLVNLFDKSYYGTTDIDKVVAESLGDSPGDLRREPAPRKLISHYSSHDRTTPIHVGLAVANVLTGALEVMPEGEPVVDGLVASLSFAPLFSPVQVGDKLFVDGSNVANIPTRALLNLLKRGINPKSKGVHIYSVVPLPSVRRDLHEGEEPEILLNLWDVVKQALNLQRWRDVFVERNLTRIITDVIPKKHFDTDLPRYWIEVDSGDGPGYFFRAWVTPIELESRVSLNERIATARKEERRKAIAETIADGCRSSLESMTAWPASSRVIRTIRCSQATRHHLQQQAALAQVPDVLAESNLPGSGPLGPGLEEICRNCALNRGRADASPQTLRVQSHTTDCQPWPHEGLAFDPDPAESQLSDTDTGTGSTNVPTLPTAWPRKRRDEPTISLLFGGGVFRGVYQMGVLNALNELSVKPDLIAGASVGSITAAMIAKVFSIDDSTDDDSTDDDSTERSAQIARLAATYLGIDRLILTDRFADFIRKMTIRAAGTEISIRQADRVFRKYDYPSSRHFDKSVREVIAGIERLLYINPYQLNGLIKAFRNHNLAQVMTWARKLVQQWLDRMQVGDQILGAEALDTLIEHFVISEAGIEVPAEPPRFSIFHEKGIHILATTSNLTRGCLEVLGSESPDANLPCGPILREGLLASSAFPAVFRPRWSWDLYPGLASEQQYIDGGTMDNFPIDAVIEYLLQAQEEERICPRPGPPGTNKPHLIFGASLEIETPSFLHRDEWAHLTTNWPRLLARSKQLGYNQKIDTFEVAERHIRSIYEQVLKEANKDEEESQNWKTDLETLGMKIKPLDIEVVTVKPQWLCGTFAFHPMLGFRRSSQAKSIAHGCASTLLRFARAQKDFCEAWGIAKGLPEERGVGRAWERWKQWKKDNRMEARSSCWLRLGTICPFSGDSLTRLNEKLVAKQQPALKIATIKELETIHKHCRDPSTHRPSGDSTSAVAKALRRRGWAP